jgi:hypothetical protein
MKMPLKAAWLGGIITLSLALGPSAGVAQSAAPAASPAPAAAAPAAPAAPLSDADQAALKADPDCKPADVACAWTSCYPLADKYNGSNSACLVASCKIAKGSACMPDLISDLNDPDRQASKGTK